MPIDDRYSTAALARRKCNPAQNKIYKYNAVISTLCFQCAAAILRFRQTVAHATTFPIVLSLSLCHLLNDMMRSLMPALYPALKANYAVDFAQIGLITLAFQCTASLLQPLIGA